MSDIAERQQFAEGYLKIAECDDIILEDKHTLRVYADTSEFERCPYWTPVDLNELRDELREIFNRVPGINFNTLASRTSLVYELAHCDPAASTQRISVSYRFSGALENDFFIEERVVRLWSVKSSQSLQYQHNRWISPEQFIGGLTAMTDNALKLLWESNSKYPNHCK